MQSLSVSRRLVTRLLQVVNPILTNTERAVGASSKPPLPKRSLKASEEDKLKGKVQNQADTINNMKPNLPCDDPSVPSEPTGTRRKRETWKKSPYVGADGFVPLDKICSNVDYYTDEYEVTPLLWDGKCAICGKMGEHHYLNCPYFSHYPEGAHLEPDAPIEVVGIDDPDDDGPKRVIFDLEKAKNYDFGKYKADLTVMGKRVKEWAKANELVLKTKLLDDAADSEGISKGSKVVIKIG